LNLVFGHDKTVADWVDKKFGYPSAPYSHAIGIIDKSGALIGGAVFRDWNGFNIELAYYGPGSVTPSLFRQIAKFCFEHLKVTRVTARTLRANKIVNQGLPKLGFHFEGVSKRYYGPTKSKDAINYVFLREDFDRMMERWSNVRPSL
jgi:RimJ/RimL family protein N-acetyltransferase